MRELHRKPCLARVDRDRVLGAHKDCAAGEAMVLLPHFSVIKRGRIASRDAYGLITIDAERAALMGFSGMNPQ